MSVVSHAPTARALGSALTPTPRRVRNFSSARAVPTPSVVILLPPLSPRHLSLRHHPTLQGSYNVLFPSLNMTPPKLLLRLHRPPTAWLPSSPLPPSMSLQAADRRPRPTLPTVIPPIPLHPCSFPQRLHPSSRASRRCQTYLGPHPRRDRRRPQGLPRQCHP